jgi:hypothetical protein
MVEHGTRAAIEKKFSLLRLTMTERSRRLWAGAEADALGYGGVAAVAAATKLAISTVRKGRDEVRSGALPSDVVHDRRPGGGRPRLEMKDPAIRQRLDSLVDPLTRGDPESPLRWSCKSTRGLSRELTGAGHRISPQKVGALLRESGYSLQVNSKMKEGKSHPDRNAQFEHINERVKTFLGSGLPVVSVDSKKKELVGDFSNSGREWQPKGTAVEVLTYDFPNQAIGRATPYGVYDVGANDAYVNVGMEHDTPTFAARSLEMWWDSMGASRYPAAKELMVTADSGGSNSARSHMWKAGLQGLADRTGLTIHVSHFPPGTSKWNKIEHRLFSFITLNWRGRPLTSYETIVSLIGSTTTTKGLRVMARLDPQKYPLGVKLPQHQLSALALEPAAFHGEWNYTLRPRTAELVLEASRPPPAKRRLHRRAHWEAILREHQNSGLNSKEFCRLRGLNYVTFLCARHRYVGRLRPLYRKRSR